MLLQLTMYNVINVAPDASPPIVAAPGCHNDSPRCSQVEMEDIAFDQSTRCTVIRATKGKMHYSVHEHACTMSKTIHRVAVHRNHQL